MNGCNVANRCLPSVSQIQISLTLFNVYTLQHARFQTTPRRSPLYSCMHGFQTSGSLIQIFGLNFTLIMTSPILLHPQSSLLFIIVPLTFSRACRRPHPSHPPSAFSSSIAQIRLFTLGRSPMVCVGPLAPSLRHTSIDMPL